MLSESEMKGYFNTPPSVQEQMIELEKKLYYKFAKQWDNQLFFFLSFAKQDTSNEQGYQYNFIPLKVETKEEWENLFKRLTSLGLQEECSFLIEQGRSLPSIDFPDLEDI